MWHHSWKVPLRSPRKWLLEFPRAPHRLECQGGGDTRGCGWRRDRPPRCSRPEDSAGRVALRVGGNPTAAENRLWEWHRAGDTVRKYDFTLSPSVWLGQSWAFLVPVSPLTKIPLRAQRGPEEFGENAIKERDKKHPVHMHV